MRSEKGLKRIDYRHFIAVGLALSFFAFGVFVMGQAYSRVLEGLRDIGTSLGFYFCYFAGFPDALTPTVTTAPTNGALPETAAAFWDKSGQLLRLLIDGDNLGGYFGSAAGVLGGALPVLVIILPVVIIVIIAFKGLLKRGNVKHGRESLPLKAYKRLAASVFVPTKKFVSGFLNFLSAHGAYFKIYLLIWLLNLNVATILLEFLAYLFYFSVALDVASVYTQFRKLFADLSALGVLPWWSFLILGLYLFDRFRKKIAYSKLRHMEMYDRGFISSLPIVSYVCGTMGSRKTTMLTDMALSQNIMFRDKAFELLLDNDLKFPYFPWAVFERDLKSAIKNKEMYNLAGCERYIYNLAARFVKDREPENLFGYDYGRYGLYYDDKLKVVDVFEVLATYAKLFFIYVMTSSLLIANYSIRDDSILADQGNFPRWNGDFFKRDSRRIGAYSRHSHILDFDMLRLGKTVLEDNEKSNVFEFGVVVITESGKERGNMLDNKGKDKKDVKANQNNDGFNRWLKLVRHSATVDNFPFVKIFMDDQRPESMGADVRELCEIVHIREAGEFKLALPFFFICELLYAFVFPRFKGMYYDFRFARGDNVLFVYLIKKLAAALYRYYRRVYNRFSYCKMEIDTETGRLEGDYTPHKYFLMTKKIYALRFSTDAFGEFFALKSSRSAFGLSDVQEYETTRASMSELAAQNSYFINELKENFK